jgi:23S rRNA A2030 N6-methylase RlmJ
MANRHFGNIGDIWKHLPLAEMLAIEKPKRYWESHAGSAGYRLTHSPARDYGIYRFLAGAPDSIGLASSSFLCLLDGLRTKRGLLKTYPGSPRIAMEMLGNGCRFLFCDIDGRSLKSIKEAAQHLGIPDDNLECVMADGVATVLRAAASVAAAEASATLVLIDPCAGDDPFARTPTRPSPMDAFARAAGAGIKAILWYSFDSVGQRRACWEGITSSLEQHGVDSTAARLWYGELSLRELDAEDSGFNPGVRGCGILCGNLTSQATSAGSRLGHELARVYSNVHFPGGASGALDFRSASLDIAVMDS